MCALFFSGHSFYNLFLSATACVSASRIYVFYCSFFSSHLEYGLSFRKFMRSLLRSNWHRLLHLDPILDTGYFLLFA